MTYLSGLKNIPDCEYLTYCCDICLIVQGLEKAVWENDIEEVKKLLTDGADINVKVESTDHSDDKVRR